MTPMSCSRLVDQMVDCDRKDELVASGSAGPPSANRAGRTPGNMLLDPP